MIIKKGRELINIDIRLKIREIIFAVLLCYFTIKINLHKHHIVSIIIISLCLILLFLLEIVIQIKKKKYMNLTFKFLFLQCFVNMSRVFSDTIEKYLLEINFVDPFKLLEIKNIFEIF